MIRIVFENVLLFLLPTLLYVAYIAVMRATAPDGSATESGTAQRGILDDAPLLYLFAAGVGLVLVMLIAFGSTSGGKPNESYTPPSIKDGHIEPGHTDQPATRE